MMRLFTCFAFAFLLNQLAFSQTPQYAWNKVIGGYMTESEIGSDGYIYIIGSWIGVRDFDPGASTMSMTSSGGGTQEAMFFGKYSANGDLIWVKSVVSSNSPVVAAALALDENNNIFLYFSSPDINLDVDPGAGVVNYYAGNQYVGGYYHGAYAVKFDDDGNYIWSQPVYREAYTGVVIQDIVYDGQYVYATGMAPANYYGGWVRYGEGPDCGCYLFTPSGFSATDQGFHVAWNAESGDAMPTNTGLSNNGGNSPPRIAFDDLHYRYVLWYTSYDQYAGCDLRKYEPYSSLLAWSRIDAFDPDYYVEGLAVINITDMQVDNDYNIYFAGNFSTNPAYDTYMLTNSSPPDSLHTTSLGDYDQFLLKYDNLGYGVWAIQLENGGGYEVCTAFELDESNGDVYIAGNIIGTTDFDPGAGVFNLVNTLGASSSDYYIAKYSTDGNLIYAGQFAGGQSVQFIPDDIVINSNSEIILSGRLNNGPVDVDLGPGVVNMTAPSSNYGAFVSYAACSGAPLEPALIVGEELVCEGNAYTYSASFSAGATSYAWTLPLGWSGDSDGQSITVYPASNPGVIEVTANNPCGASSAQTFAVNTYAPTVVAVASDESICEGEQITLSGQGVSNYAWNNNVVNGASFAPAATTTYTVTGTDENGCSASDDVTITVLQSPDVEATASDNEVCEGDFVTLGGTGAISYTWSNTVLNGVPFAAVESQVYTVTGTGINNCTAQYEIEIVVHPIPDVAANASDSTICTGGALILYGTGADTYEWTLGIGNGAPFFPSESATYGVTGTNAFGCEASDIVEIIVADVPAVDAIATDESICFGSSVTLHGEGAVNFTWSNNVENGIAFSPISTDTYTVVGVDENGCSAVDEITIEVLQNPTVSANASASEVCEGSQVVLYGEGAIGFVWSNGVIDNEAFEPTSTQTYMVTGTDANGCEDTDEVTVVVNDMPIILFSLNDNTYCTTDPVVILSATPSGGEYFGTGVSGTIFNPAIAPGSYSISYVYTSSDGCTASESVDVVVEVCDGIEVQSIHEDFSVFPNPATDNTLLTWTGDFDELVVYSMQGELVKRINTKGLQLYNLSCSDLASGVYSLQLSGIQPRNIRLIVE